MHPFILADQQNSQPNLQGKKKTTQKQDCNLFICLHLSQKWSVWDKLHLNILISVQMCCALSS